MRFSLLFLLLFSPVLLAKSKQVELVESLALSDKAHSHGDLGKLLPDEYKMKAKGLTLLGDAKTRTLEDGEKITTIVWYALEKPKRYGKREMVLLEQPAMTAIKVDGSTNKLPKKQKLPIDAQDKTLLKALDQLIEGKNLVSTKQRISLEAVPTSNKRRVESPLLIDTQSDDNAKTIANHDDEQEVLEESALSERFNGHDGFISSSQKPINQKKSANSSESTNGVERSIKKAQLNVQGSRAGTQQNPALGIGVQKLQRQSGKNSSEQSDPQSGQNSSEQSDPLSGDELPSLNHGERVGRDMAEIAPERSSVAGDEEDTIRVELTTAGCYPHVDEVHHRVTIYNRAITYKNEQILKEEHSCSPSLEVYPLEKDYLFDSGSSRTINDMAQKVAFNQFIYYWIDGDGERRVHDGIKTDTANPHPFVDEKGHCGLDVDLINNKVYPKVETIFYDRFNARTLVKACHRDDSKGADIVETEAGCELEHDFPGGRSWLQKQKVAEIGGVMQTVKICARSGAPMPHTFDTKACGRLVNHLDGKVHVMARRKIRVADEKRYISGCEPIDSSRLQSTIEGCEADMFVHDFTAGRSYYKKRYYYSKGNTRKYVTQCLRSNEFVAHLPPETIGYNHDDANKCSYPKTVISMMHNHEKRVISTPKVELDATPIPYQLVKTENKPTGTHTYDGCYKLSQTQQLKHYRRVDNTIYHLTEGSGPVVRGPNECRDEVKLRAHYVGRLGSTDCCGEFSSVRLYQIFRVQLRHYPGDRASQIISEQIEKDDYAVSDCGEPSAFWKNGGFYKYKFSIHAPDASRWATLVGAF